MLDDDSWLWGDNETEKDSDNEGAEEVLWQDVLHEVHLEYREKNRHIKLCCQEQQQDAGCVQIGAAR